MSADHAVRRHLLHFLDVLQKAAKEIQESGVKAIAISCNVLKDEDLVNLVDSTVK